MKAELILLIIFVVAFALAYIYQATRDYNNKTPDNVQPFDFCITCYNYQNEPWTNCIGCPVFDKFKEQINNNETQLSQSKETDKA